MNPKKIAALIPALNESESLTTLIPETQRWIQDVIVVDDGSTDETSEVSKREGAILLRHSTNEGKGAALQTGFRFLLEKGYEGCIVIDGDGQHSPQDIPIFLESMSSPEVGVVIGNRMEESSSMPRVRFWTNRVMSFILSKFLHEEIPDSQCGFRYIRSEVLRISNFKSSRYAIDSEILIEAKRHGYCIRSVPIRTIYRSRKSGIRVLRDTYFFIKLLLTELMRPS